MLELIRGYDERKLLNKYKPVFWTKLRWHPWTDLCFMKSWVKLQEKSKFRIKGRIEEPQNQEPKSKKHISLRTEINQNMGQFERNWKFDGW
jgi:hypothetical protein